MVYQMICKLRKKNVNLQGTGVRRVRLASRLGSLVNHLSRILVAGVEHPSLWYWIESPSTEGMTTRQAI